jgi:hypothetical protein
VVAEQCAVAFVEHWVTRFGVPAVATSDQGTLFPLATCSLDFPHVMTSVGEPHHFYAAQAPVLGTNFDAAPASAPTLLYS